ncbi:MAG: 4Fe-4S binding protein [Synergistaceae bacterium]|nr:4Fe-4S binding protein [Synergistaceae bacterium]
MSQLCAKSLPGRVSGWRDVPIGTVTFGASARAVETGLWRSVRPVMDAGKCVSCLKCWAQCPDSSILTDESGRVCGINEFFCKGCGICAEICPVTAISMRPESDFAGEAAGSPRRGSDPGSVGEFIGP